MFGEMSLLQMIMKGGSMVVALIAISILSWWIIIDRLIKFSRIRVNPVEFMEKVRRLFESKDPDSAITLCQSTPGVVPAVILEGIKNRKKETPKIESAMQRALNHESERMQGSLGWLGTIGNVTPFIGLLGTVLGIIRAFHDLSLSSGGGPAVVAAGIAEALVATAAGLFVAIPAVIFYNYFVKKIDTVETETLNAASEFIDIIEE